MQILLTSYFSAIKRTSFYYYNTHVPYYRPCTKLHLQYKTNKLKIMATINPSDIIFATIKQHGRILHTLQFSGVLSFSELMKQILNALSSVKGLITLNLRNGSQGWSQQRAIMLS